MHIKSSSSHKTREPESGVLYIVGTPIGNLNDLSFRALNILRNVSLVACEDTRQTKKIMGKYDFKNCLISFNKHNSISKIPTIINHLQLGKSIALVSDAGMPSICDPGEDLVRESKLCGIEVICIPGPCAALTALVSSGLPSSSFVFAGFLPRKKTDREKILFEISKNERTTIIYESPHRLIRLLRELKDYCGENREIHISRELTKKFEQHISTNVGKVIDYFHDKEIIGEITIIIKGSKKEKNKDFDTKSLKKELCELVELGLTLSNASKYLAKKKNLKKSEIYNLY